MQVKNSHVNRFLQKLAMLPVIITLLVVNNQANGTVKRAGILCDTLPPGDNNYPANDATAFLSKKFLTPEDLIMLDEYLAGKGEDSLQALLLQNGFTGAGTTCSDTAAIHLSRSSLLAMGRNMRITEIIEVEGTAKHSLLYGSDNFNQFSKTKRELIERLHLQKTTAYSNSPGEEYSSPGNITVIFSSGNVACASFYLIRISSQ